MPQLTSNLVRHRFVVGLGGVICTGCASKREGASPLSLPALKTLRHFHRNGDSETPRIRISSALYEEVRAVLDRAIRYWLDRDVRSRRFVVQVQRQKSLLPSQHPFPLDGGRFVSLPFAKAGDFLIPAHPDIPIPLSHLEPIEGSSRSLNIIQTPDIRRGGKKPAHSPHPKRV